MKITPTVFVSTLVLASVGAAAGDEVVRFAGETHAYGVCRRDSAGCSQFQGYVVVNPARSGLDLSESAQPSSGLTAANAADLRLRRIYLGADAP